MEKRTRYNELLGIPNSIRDPDLYQLLGLDRGSFDDAQVEERYRERMGTLQGIKSPKHKSFIEFLKGELRRARSTLVDAKQRQAYDLELLEERKEQLLRILDVVLADGVLREAEERRLQEMAAEVGLFPDEVEALLREELARRGARRDSAMGPVTDARPAAPDDRRTASSSDIQRAIARTLPPRQAAPPLPRRPAAASAPFPAPFPTDEEEEEEIVAELVEEAPADPGPRFRSETPGQGGWGRATVVHVAGVCSSCLGEVIDHDVTRGRAERLDDGRLHCPGCYNRLAAGLICGACYQRVTRSDMKSGKLKVHGGRVHHGHCITG